MKQTRVTERFQERDLRAKVASESNGLVEASERPGHADTATAHRIYRRKSVRGQPLRKKQTNPFLLDNRLHESKRKPWKNGAPGEIRTPDRLVRSQVLYPTELRAPRFWWRIQYRKL